MNHECLFCNIVNGKIPADKLFEDEALVVFKDIKPIAPTHLLVIPKKHYASLNDIPQHAFSIMAKLFAAAQEAAHRNGIDQEGYRTIINTGPHAGQVIFHVHLHVIGGRQLGPMG